MRLRLPLSGKQLADRGPYIRLAQVLENTLWNRQLGVMSEEIVAALVCQIFEGGPLIARCTLAGCHVHKPALCWSHRDCVVLPDSVTLLALHDSLQHGENASTPCGTLAVSSACS